MQDWAPWATQSGLLLLLPSGILERDGLTTLELVLWTTASRSDLFCSGICVDGSTRQKASLEFLNSEATKPGTSASESFTLSNRT